MEVFRIADVRGYTCQEAPKAMVGLTLQILSNIEAAQRNNRLFAALKEGNTALQQLQSQVALEDVERLNEETSEAKEYQDQLRELLGQSLSAQDDAEALEELERIQVGGMSLLPIQNNQMLHTL